MPLILNPAAAFTQKGLKPSMNGESIFDVIIQGYSSLTRSEIRVADYILKHKPELPYIMSKTLADACQVSEATITRFCRSVGCASFNDFKVRAAQAISSDSTSGPASGYDLYGDIQLEDSLEQMPKAIPRRHSGPATDAGLAGLRRGPQGGGLPL